MLIIYFSRGVDNFDLQSYRLVGELTAKGFDVYSRIASLRYPYLPVFLYLEGLAHWLGRSGGLGRFGETAIIKIIINAFDIGNVYLIYRLTGNNLKKAFLYAVNPVSLLVFCFHGQFDAIPIFFLLLSLYLIKVKKNVSAVLAFSFAVAVKTWPFLFSILIFKKLKNKKLIFLTVIFPLLSIFAYAVLFRSSFVDISKTIVGYQGLWGIWGVGEAIGQIRLRWQKLLTGIFLSGFLLYSFRLKEKNILKGIYGMLLFFFVYTTNFSVQYFSWLMPFLAAADHHNFLTLALPIAFYLALSYSTWLFPSASLAPLTTLTTPTALTYLSLILWLYLATFLFRRLRKKNPA